MATVRMTRLAATAVAALAIVIVFPQAAFAHVAATAESAGEGMTRVTFTFRHGCDGAPTDSLRVQLPAGASEVTPQDPPGWTSDIANGVLQWRGGSVPDGTVGTFIATMRIPGTTGETVYLPTVQGCPGGKEEPWLERTPDPEATSAAPRIALVATTEVSVSTTTSSAATTMTEPGSKTEPVRTPPPTTTSAPSPPPSAAAASGEGSSSAAWILLPLAVVVVTGGVFGFFTLTRQRSTR